MARYVMTYQIEIEAPSHEAAALKGLSALTDDLTDPYTEISVKTENLDGHAWCNDDDFISTKENIVGIQKDTRGRRTFTIVTDEIGDNHK